MQRYVKQRGGEWGRGEQGGGEREGVAGEHMRGTSGEERSMQEGDNVCK